jgi:DNA polymerase III delta subunit
MTFNEFKKYKPSAAHNVFVFACEDDFIIEESRSVWAGALGSNWVFEKLQAKEFDEIETGRLMDEALTPSLFSQCRVLMVANGEKVSKRRADDFAALQQVTNSSLKVILLCSTAKTAEPWTKSLPLISIDPLRPGDAARWLTERHGLSAEVARYVVENAGTELYPLHNEMEKLKTYLGGDKQPSIDDVEAGLLHAERFGPFELDDALLARDYRKAVLVTGSLLDEGAEPLLVLGKIVRVWRQLFVGKGLLTKKGANEAAAGAGVPNFKASAFAAACRKYSWSRLARGFRDLLAADRALKTSSPNIEAYFDILLWKLTSPDPDLRF